MWIPSNDRYDTNIDIHTRIYGYSRFVYYVFRFFDITEDLSALQYWPQTLPDNCCNNWLENIAFLYILCAREQFQLDGVGNQAFKCSVMNAQQWLWEHNCLKTKPKLITLVNDMRQKEYMRILGRWVMRIIYWRYSGITCYAIQYRIRTEKRNLLIFSIGTNWNFIHSRRILVFDWCVSFLRSPSLMESPPTECSRSQDNICTWAIVEANTQ